MKKKLIIFSTILMVVMLVLGTTVLAADNSVSVSLTSNSKLEENSTVVVNVNLTNVNAGEGINGLIASLNYDKNVFETVKSSDITSSTQWSTTYADSTNKIISDNENKINKASTMYTITLKTKAAINTNSTTISLKDGVASGGIVTGDIPVNNASVTIKKDTTETITDTTDTTTTTGTTSTTTTTNKVSDKTTTTQKTLPKTGIAQYGFIAIISVMLVGMISYVLYKNISKEVK